MKKISIFISYVLRHSPGEFGIDMDKNGWVSTEQLIEKTEDLNLNLLKEIVSTDDKSRYSFKNDFDFIRANQGHSVEVDLELEALTPPDILYHGTSTKTLQAIIDNGLQKMSRHHVHLSKDTETANTVGSRHGRIVLLRIDSKKMYEDGLNFYLSENGVWLTDSVGIEYITILDS